MSRLPTPGSDTGNWGKILNDYLSQSHTDTGLLKNNIVSSAALQDTAVTSSKLADGAVTAAKLDSSLSAALSSKLDSTAKGQPNGIASLDASGKVPASQLPAGGGSGGGTVSNATASSPGLIQLSGDLSGTATAPLVSKLSGVSITNTPTPGQVLTASSGTAAAWVNASGSSSSGGIVWNSTTEPTAAQGAKDGDLWLDTATANILTKARVNGQWVTLVTTPKPVNPDPDPDPDPTPDPTPTNGTTSDVTDTSVTLNWTAPANPGGTVSGYNVYDGTTKKNTEPITETSYSVTGLTAGTSYSFTIKPIVDGTESSKGLTISVKTTGGDPDPDPEPTKNNDVTGLKAAPTATSAALSWTAPANPTGTVEGYNVYQGTEKLNTELITETSYSVTGLTTGTDYSFTIKTVVGGEENTGITITTKTGDGGGGEPGGGTGDQKPLGVPGNWKLAFSDDFNGTSLDLTKWTPNWFGEGGTMNRVGCYSSNVRVEGGSMILSLASSTSGALVHSDYSEGRYQVMPGGYAEARIHFPGSADEHWYNWPAWWISGPSWPNAGEHDIAEGLSGNPTVNYHSPSGAHNQGRVEGTWNDGFHVYGVHRKAKSADVYWDGVIVKSYDTDDNGEGEELLFNVGVGDLAPHIGTEGEFKVDYARAWIPE